MEKVDISGIRPAGSSTYRPRSKNKSGQRFFSSLVSTAYERYIVTSVTGGTGVYAIFPEKAEKVAVFSVATHYCAADVWFT